ncbi:MAG: hypothetical protein AAGG45_01585 [Pseudomonadota bacterium]
MSDKIGNRFDAWLKEHPLFHHELERTEQVMLAYKQEKLVQLYQRLEHDDGFLKLSAPQRSKTFAQLRETVERAAETDFRVSRLRYRMELQILFSTEQDQVDFVDPALTPQPSPRPEHFDFFIALTCDPETADHSLQELDYMWDTVWSQKFPGWRAHLISTKNAIGIVMGGLAKRLLRIGAIGFVAGFFKALLGRMSL